LLRNCGTPSFALLFASSYAGAGDVYNTVGCLARICGCLTQVLYALNEVYFMSDKGALVAVGQFALCPPDYSQRVSQLLASPGGSLSQLTDTVASLRELLSEVVSLADGLYQPKYILRGSTDRS